MPLALLLLLAAPASAAPPKQIGIPFFAVTGGFGPTGGSLSGFTQQTAASPRRSDSRPFGTSDAVGLRVGAWYSRESPWGGALELSRVHMPVRGGRMEVWGLSWLLLARPRGWHDRKVFPYAGLGLTSYLADLHTNYQPVTAEPVKRGHVEPPFGGLLTFDARVGARARLTRRLFALAEARLTRFAYEEESRPATWFGPTNTYNAGVGGSAAPFLLCAGLGLEY